MTSWATEGVSLREVKESPRVAEARLLNRLIDRQTREESDFALGLDP